MFSHSLLRTAGGSKVNPCKNETHLLHRENVTYHITNSRKDGSGTIPRQSSGTADPGHTGWWLFVSHYTGRPRACHSHAPPHPQMVDLQEKRWTYSETTLLTDLKNGLTDLKSALTAIFRFNLKQNDMKTSLQAAFSGLKGCF
jgi:hypothetical protein